MKMVILVSFMLVLPMFSSGIVENVNQEVKEVVMNGRRIDLELDYAGPHLRPSTPAGGRPPRPQVDEVVTKEPLVYIKDDYVDPAPVPKLPRPIGFVRPPPPPPFRPSP